jgi:LEA14-like dessication related protein
MENASSENVKIEVSDEHVEDSESQGKPEERMSGLLIDFTPSDKQESKPEYFGLAKRYGKYNAMKILFCGCIIALCIVFLPILFTVVIPDIVQGMVDDSEIEIMQVVIRNPNNDSFESYVVEKFKNTGSMSAEIQMHSVSLFWNDAGGGKMAKLNSNNRLDITADEVEMKSRASVVDADLMTDFNLYAISAEFVDWRIDGPATVYSFMTADVSVDKTVRLRSFNNFPIDPQVLELNTTGGSNNTLFTEMLINFTSPGQIELDLGQDLQFEVYSQGVRVGTGTIPDCDMVSGSFTYFARVEMTPFSSEQRDQVSKVVSNYSMGLDCIVSMGPFFTPTPVSWLQPALASISVSSVMPGLRDKLVLQLDLYPPRIPIKVPFTMYMLNPIDAGFTLQHLQSTIYSSGVKIATVNTDTDLYIAPHSYVLSPKYDSISETSVEALQVFSALEAAGFGYLDIYCLMTAKIGDFPVTMIYNQLNISTYIHV